MANLKISVVIGTYNQKDKLRQVLESLYKQTLQKDQFEIIVVDSKSTDGTPEMMKDLLSRYPLPVTRYFIQENLGRPGARNRGISEAQSDIILLTDADMLADTNLLAEHIKAHDKKKNAIFEGLTINPDNLPYIKEKIRPMQKIRWSYFLTGNLSIPKDIIKNAGMFDQQFAGYGWEDIELGYRLKNMGYSIYYLPSAINFHMHPVTQKEMFDRKYHMGKSAAIFYKKHHNLEIKYYLGMNPIAQFVYKLIKFVPGLKNYIEKRAQFSGFYGYLLEEFLYRKGLEENLR